MKHLIYTLPIALTLSMSVSAAAQDNSQSSNANAEQSSDAGPPKDSFENNDNAWFCEGDGFVADHCINARSQGTVGNIMVFQPDPRGPQESVSSDPKFDNVPCNHDGNADSDGSWWEIVEGLFVCHHNGSQ